jgi:hypothetical protein
MNMKDGAEWSLSTLGEPMSLIKTGFEMFWEKWPKHPRKGAKSECKKKWDKLQCELVVDTILKHIEWLKTTEQWKKQDGAFIPAPLVYLNQQRWDGAEIPEIKPPTAKDETLIKIEESRRSAVPMPDDVRERLAQLRRIA